MQITVNNLAPTIDSIADADGKPFDIPTNIDEGQSVQLTATASDPELIKTVL